jgi:hypothetical protein
MSLTGGKVGGTTDAWSVPDCPTHCLPTQAQAEALLHSMQETEVGARPGEFVSKDGRIGATVVDAYRVSRTDGGHEAITATERAARVDWAESGDGLDEVSFCITGARWKGRAGLEQLVRERLRAISEKARP